MKKVIALYARTSGDNQALGLAGQEKSLRAWAKAHHPKTPIRIYKDENISGKKASRPAFDKMMEASANGEISLISVYSISRISRSVINLYTFIDTITRQDTCFHSLTESFDTSTPTGKLMLGLLAAFAQFESDITSERTKNAYKAAKENGVRWGPKPKKRDTRRLMALRAQGMTLRAIANATGYPYGTVAKDLKNTVKGVK